MDQAMMKLGSGLSEEPSSDLALYPKRRRERRGKNGGMPSNQIITERLDRRKKKKREKGKKEEKILPKVYRSLKEHTYWVSLASLPTFDCRRHLHETCNVIVGTERVYFYLRLGTASTRNKVSRPFPIEFEK